MATYNCIIKELPVGSRGLAKIIGRIFLQDLSGIPDEWEIRLRRTFVGKVDLQKLMDTFTSTNPIIIYKTSSVQFLPIKKVMKMGNIYRLNIHGYTMKYLKSTKTAFDEGVEPQGPSIKLDIDCGTSDGMGVETSNFWKSYRHGMNLAGKCSNMECDSRKQTDTENKIFYHKGYGEIYLHDDEYKLECSACGHSSFQISNFVLSCGRALFRYKIGIDSEVKEFILESSGSLEEFKTFDIPTDQSIIDYDFILIMTVATDQSFYCCLRCEEIIDEGDDEEMLSCGHSYHKSTCSPGSNIGCIVCEAEPLESISVLLTVGNT